MSAFSGNYPIEHRAGEIARLRLQSKAMEPDTLAMLDRFGSMEGRTCVDLAGARRKFSRKSTCCLFSQLKHSHRFAITL